MESFSIPPHPSRDLAFLGPGNDEPYNMSALFPFKSQAIPEDNEQWFFPPANNLGLSDNPLFASMTEGATLRKLERCVY